MKKFFGSAAITLLIAFLLAGCAQNQGGITASPEAEKGDKLQIVATLFPQYDFARQIAGDKAEVILLLPPGVESHSFEPTPSDIIKINRSDLFVYTGDTMEVWAGRIIDGMKSAGSESLVLDVSQGIDLTDDGVVDPHIWTDPVNAEAMSANILEALCSLDPANTDYYRANAAGFSAALSDLDAEFQTIVNNGKRNKIIFGSRFALHYFVKRYGLTAESAFDSCSSETEPSVRAVAELIERIKNEEIPVIYYAELEDPKVARAISAETGAKLLLFHSCHNVTKEELEEGVTYLSLMKQNAEHLKEGLE